MREILTEIFYRPLFNALAWLYANVALEDLGLAIIILTIIVRLVLFPLFQKTAKHQKITQNLQPKIKKLQKQHKDDKETQAKKIIELYSEHKINPLTPLLALLIQLPIIFVLYRIFIHGFSDGALELLYPSINFPAMPNQTFLGSDLTQPSLWIAGVAAAAQLIQGKLTFSRKKKQGEEESKAEKIGKNMMYFMPLLTLGILWNLPAAVGVYWSTTTFFSIFQQWLVNRSLNKEGEEKLSLGSNGKGKGQNSEDI